MPTSVLWVTLIAVWLFVLIPMVLRGRPQARKTTAAAANTRLVHRGGSTRQRASRTATRTRAAQRAAANADEQTAERRRKAAAAKAEAAAKLVEAEEAEAEETEDAIAEDTTVEDEAVEVEAELVDDEAADESTDETDENDDDVVDAEIEIDADADFEAEAEADDETEDEATDDGIDVVSAAEMTDQIPVVPDEVVDIDEAQAARDADQIVDDEHDEHDEDAEFDEDLAYEDDAEYEELEYDEDDEYEDDEADESEDAEHDPVDEPSARELRGRGGYGPDRLVEREAMQYRERQRMVVVFALATVGAIVSAFFFQPWGIALACGMVAAFGTYLALLRRAVRHENVRRAQRAARRRRQQQEDAKLESRQAEPTYVEPPARLRRPGGAVVLEIDDEDPAFDHLPTYDFADQTRYEDEYDDGRTATYGRAAV